MRSQDDLVTLLVKYDKDFQEIKARQYSGSSNIVAYENETEDEWDMDWTPSSVGGLGYAQRTVTVTFTAENQPAAFTAIEMDAYYNGVRYSNENQPFMYQIFDRQVSSDIDVAKYSYTAQYVIQADTTQRIQLKFRAKSTDVGELNVSWVTNIGS